ncbi:MAG: hypothetical protein ACRC8P_00955 [Spiroplasma sp.]
MYDISQLTIPWDNIDTQFIIKSRKWDSKSIIPFALWNGSLSSVFDITIFLFIGYGLKVFTSHNLALFQSSWFIVGIVTQTLIFHLLRIQKVPFIQSIAFWPVIVLLE